MIIKYDDIARNIRVLRTGPLFLDFMLCINNKDKKAPSSPSQKKRSRAVVAQHLEADSCRCSASPFPLRSYYKRFAFLFLFVRALLPAFFLLSTSFGDLFVGFFASGHCPGKWTTSFFLCAYLGCCHS